MNTNLPPIVCDPAVMDGLPIITGTRIPVYIILELLEAGMSEADILSEYPHLHAEQIRSAIGYARESLCEGRDVA